jgi:hypothetical protein
MQVGVFSATLPPEALEITRKFMNKPVGLGGDVKWKQGGGGLEADGSTMQIAAAVMAHHGTGGTDQLARTRTAKAQGEAAHMRHSQSAAATAGRCSGLG